MKYLLIHLFFFIFAASSAVSLPEKTVQAALPNNVNVQECLENPELCQQENQNVAETQSESASAVGIGLWDILRMIAALVFVVALLYFLLRFINKKSLVYQDSQFVRNLGGTALGGSRSIQVVKAGDRILIVGVGDDVSLLTEIKDQAEYEAFLSQYQNQSNLLNQPVVSRLKKNWFKQSIQDSSFGFQEELKSQMDELKKNRTKAVRKAATLEQNRHE